MKGCEDCKHYWGTRYAVDDEDYGTVRETSQCARHVLATGKCKDYEPSDKAAPAPKSLAPIGESIGDILRDMDIGVIPFHKRDREITRWYSARLKAALSRLSMARKSEFPKSLAHTADVQNPEARRETPR